MRNGKIELMRFLFALSILGYHLQLDCWSEPKLLGQGFYLFSSGKAGVEFFYLLSGFLMAKSIASQVRKNTNESLGEESLHFLWRKIKGFLPYHLTFGVIAFIFRILRSSSLHAKISYALNILPSFLLLQSAGLYQSGRKLIAPEWYLSSLLISILLLYPICRKFWNTFPYTVAPVIGFMGIGYLMHTYESLPGNVNLWGHYILACNIRAFCDLCLGIWCYVLTQKLSEQTLSRRKIQLLQLTEIICYLLTLVLMCRMEHLVHQDVLLFSMIGLILSFSPFGFGNSSPIFQNRFCLFLGQISLPIYLCQNVIRDLLSAIWAGCPPLLHFLLGIILTLLTSTLSVLILNRVRRGSVKRIG